jgi:phosphoserine aminotransferase
MSVMEMSHRGKEFILSPKLQSRSARTARDSVKPDLFLQGGATAQFAMVPMNC